MVDLKKLGGNLKVIARGSAIIAKDKIQEGAEKLKDVDLQETAQGMKEKAKDLQEKAKEALSDNEEDETLLKGQVLSSETAILAIHYLMCADGVIHADEEEKLLEVAQELDLQFEEHKAAIKERCEQSVDMSLDREKLYQAIEGQVGALLDQDAPTKDAVVTPKILVWDMIAIAYSDGEYSDKEKALVQFVADKLEVDPTILLELESSMETLEALEEEEQWIKTTDRPYLEIEAHVNEIADRRNVIFNSIKDLVTL